MLLESTTVALGLSVASWVALLAFIVKVSMRFGALAKMIRPSSEGRGLRHAPPSTDCNKILTLASLQLLLYGRIIITESTSTTEQDFKSILVIRGLGCA